MARAAGPGRPRKSVEDHVRDGTYRKDRHGPIPTASTSDDPVTKFPDRPASLTGRPAEVWDRLAKVLGGVVRLRDVPTLEELCRWIERAERVDAELADMDPKETRFVKTLTGAAICTDKILKLSNCFGLSPSDRAKLKPEVSQGPPKPKVMTRQPTKLDKQRGSK